MNINSSLIGEMRSKEYRDAYVSSQIRIGIPFQIRALRRGRKWKQDDLALHAKMEQPRISEIEKPGERRLNIETLLRVASAFDVALEVRFVPFSRLVDWSESFDPERFEVDGFEQEIADLTAAQMQNRSSQSKVVNISSALSRLPRGSAASFQEPQGQGRQGQIGQSHSLPPQELVLGMASRFWRQEVPAWKSSTLDSLAPSGS